MCGKFRNWEPINKFYPGCEVFINDSSIDMIKDALNIKSTLKINYSNFIVQEFPWSDHENKYDIFIGWWNLNYLKDEEIDSYLLGIRTCLKTNGFAILCESTSDIL